MKIFKKLFLFLAVFYLLTQLSLVFLLPKSAVYNKRLNYEVFKDNVHTIEPTVKAIKDIINKQNLKEYIIFVGDSVGYGTPCPPDKTMSSYMNVLAVKENSGLRVFNLGIPSSMFGDFYAVLLLLDKYGISTDNLILNFSYWEINAKTPAYWLKHYLKDLDRESYKAMVSRGHIKEESPLTAAKAELHHGLNSYFAAIGYSGFISNKIRLNANVLLNQPKSEIMVWNKKPKLPRTLNLPENRWYYSDKTFNLSESSPQIYFLNKIAEHQKEKNTLYFMNAMNDRLLNGATERPGFQDNLSRISQCFMDRGLNYIDYNKKVNYEYFSDHVHLLPEGYEFMAQDLWKKILMDKENSNAV